MSEPSAERENARGQLDALMTLSRDPAYSAEWIGQRFREWAITPGAGEFMDIEVGETPERCPTCKFGGSGTYAHTHNIKGVECPGLPKCRANAPCPDPWHAS